MNPKTLLRCFLVLILAIGAQGKLNAQRQPCAYDDKISHLDPSIKASWESKVEAYLAANNKSQFDSKVTIPVIFFIMEKSQPLADPGQGDITPDDVILQLEIMNDAFAPMNVEFCIARNKPDKTPLTPPSWLPTITVPAVQQMDPNNPGVFWVESSYYYSTYSTTVSFTTPSNLAPHVAYTNTITNCNDEDYLFIYVVPLDVPNFPCMEYGQNVVLNDPDLSGGNGAGVVVNEAAFARVVPLSTTCYETNGGQTLNHELGHQFGLGHIFGTQGCSSDCEDLGDRICDTPPQMSGGFQTNPNLPPCNLPTPQCGGSVLQGNHMDYVNDVCKNNFTFGQYRVMDASMHIRYFQMVEEEHVRNVGCGNTVIFVDHSAQGMDNGTSWTDAFKDLKDALNAAAYGDEIWVAQGTYKPSNGLNITETFEIPNGVEIYGGFMGTETSRDSRDPDANVCILSGHLGTSVFSSSVVSCLLSDDQTVLDGFTIQWGKALSGGSGGGLYLKNSEMYIRNCRIQLNEARISGGGVMNIDGSPNFTKCTFTGNRSGVSGGAIHNMGTTEPWFLDCVFEENYAGVQGDAVYNDGQLCISNYVNSVFCRNLTRKSQAGAAIYEQTPGRAVVLNCTFYGNMGSSQINLGSSNADYLIKNSIIYGNNIDFGGVLNSLSVEHSATFNGYAGTGNINLSTAITNVNQLFINASSCNLGLVAGAVVIDAGENAPIHHYYSDLSGGTRIVTLGSPCQYYLYGAVMTSTAIVDMGAFEYRVGCKNGSTAEQEPMPESLAERFVVFPNPNNGVFSIAAPEDSKVYQIEVFDVLGQKVLRSQSNSRHQKIDASHLERGIYFLKIGSGSQTQTTKIMIQ